MALGLQSAEEPSEKSRIETRGRLDRAPNYEFGGQEFESLRARQLYQKLRMVLPVDPAVILCARVHNQVHDRAGMRTRICRYIARCADSLRVNANDEDLAIGVLSKPTGCSGESGAGGS